MKIDCVFLHGWAMNSAVWQACEEYLPGSINPVYLDLPGHGDGVVDDAPETVAVTLDDYVEHIACRISQPGLLVGWSLGGLVALRLAVRYPDKVSALLLVASSPKFVQVPGWNCAVENAVFRQFAQSLQQQDVRHVIRRFLALQVRGSAASIQVARELQRALEQHGTPTIETLMNGLKILSETDSRSSLGNIHVPVTWLLGDRDAIVPVSLAPCLEQLLPGADIHIQEGGGHAPFISHAEAFAAMLGKMAQQVRL